jgi:hypothetical protein
VTDRAPVWLAVAAAVVVGVMVLAVVSDEDEGGTGFEGFIQSGTCADPTDDLAVDFESDEDADDIEPYEAGGDVGEPATIAYYGAPEVPGFGIALLYIDEPFSMVITEQGSDEPVACGDLLQPDDDDAEESGLAVAQLLPVGSSDVQGVATLERAKLERELVIAPTRARVLLTTDPVNIPAETADAYDGFVQGGTCAEPDGDLLLDLDSDGEPDVTPFEALRPGSDEPVTVALYGAAPVPGFGLAAAYVEEEAFSVFLAERGSDDPVACGDVLVPADDDYTQTGLALVRLLPTGGDGPQGYAVIDRKGMQRELDITPTLVRILLFAEPLEST